VREVKKRKERGGKEGEKGEGEGRSEILIFVANRTLKESTFYFQRLPKPTTAYIMRRFGVQRNDISKSDLIS